MTSTPGHTPREPVPGRTAQVVALVLAVVAAVVLVFLPVYGAATERADGELATSMATLVQVNGPAVVVTLMVPVLLAALPLLPLRRGRVVTSWGCAALLAAFVVLAMLSIGIFYLPSAVAAVVAAARVRA